MSTNTARTINLLAQAMIEILNSSNLKDADPRRYHAMKDHAIKILYFSDEKNKAP